MNPDGMGASRPDSVALASASGLCGSAKRSGSRLSQVTFYLCRSLPGSWKQDWIQA